MTLEHVQFIEKIEMIPNDALYIQYSEKEEKKVTHFTHITFNIRDENHVILGSKVAKKYIDRESENIIIDLKNTNINAAEFVSGFRLSIWKFTKYKTHKVMTKNIMVITDQCEKYNKLYKKNLIDAALEARELCCEPANKFNTEDFKNKISNLAQFDNVEVEIFDYKRLMQEKMEGIINVGKGSKNLPYLAIVKYNWHLPKDAIALVGKGVMFDTGGYSLKTPENMMHMNGDMGGGAAVYTALKALIQDKVQAKVIALVPIVENCISNDSMKPNDIICSDGKTIEVLNTDAEGRLILQDALSYAAHINEVKHIISIATLTGAIGLTFSSIRAGLFSNDQLFAQKIYNIGEQINEKCWNMPMDNEYNIYIKSDIADLKNVQGKSRQAGSIVAAKYLEHFVHNKTWAHLDIAGVNTIESILDIPLQSKGSTSCGTRLLYNVICKFNGYEISSY